MKMEQLEEALQALEEENKLLMEENQILQDRSSTLATENVQLKERLGMPQDVVSVKTETGSPVESAVLRQAPLQQAQIQALFQLTTSCLAYLLTLR